MPKRERQEQRQEWQWGSRRERGRVGHGEGVGKPPQSENLEENSLNPSTISFRWCFWWCCLSVGAPQEVNSTPTGELARHEGTMGRGVCRVRAHRAWWHIRSQTRVKMLSTLAWRDMRRSIPGVWVKERPNSAAAAGHPPETASAPLKVRSTESDACAVGLEWGAGTGPCGPGCVCGKGAWNSSPASIKTAPLFIFFLVFLIKEKEF